MIETETAFPYLGNRDYIHGTSILGGFVAALEAAASGGITVKKLKFQRPAQTNGRLVLKPGRLDESEAAHANCTLSASVDGAAWNGFFSESGKAVPARVPVTYPIAALEARDYGGSCLISPANRDDLVRVIVEANKRFHEASFAHGTPSVRFGYIESWSVPPAQVSFTDARLEAVNLIARKTDESVMTINRLTYAPPGAPAATLTLCFDVHPA